MKQLFEYFNGKRISSILDIATGTGQYIKVLRGIFPDAEITGIDTDAKSIREAVQNVGDAKTIFKQMEADKLDFPDNTFDMVSISKALHHLPYLKKSFTEMKRVLKPAGFIIISEPYSDNLTPAQENQKFFHHMRSFTDLKTGIYHRETWERQEIIDMMGENGIDARLIFDYFENRDLITETDNLESWVMKFKSLVDKLEGLPEHKDITAKIFEFRERIVKYGLQPVPTVVITGVFTRL